MQKVQVEDLELSISVVVYPILTVAAVEGYISMLSLFAGVAVVVILQLLIIYT